MEKKKESFTAAIQYREFPNTPRNFVGENILTELSRESSKGWTRLSSSDVINGQDAKLTLCMGTQGGKQVLCCFYLVTLMESNSLIG